MHSGSEQVRSRLDANVPRSRFARGPTASYLISPRVEAISPPEVDAARGSRSAATSCACGCKPPPWLQVPVLG